MLVATHTLRSIEELESRNLVSKNQHSGIAKVLEKFSLAITPHVLDVMSGSDSEGAVAAQFVPSTLELEEHPNESSDPIGDSTHTPVAGIIHRYSDRVLLNAIQTCAVYCRFCFRRENVGPGNGGLTPEQLDKAIKYISDDDQIWEVILSGGDPLTLSPRRLSAVIEKISAIPHVGVVRLHTRVPCVAPDKITSDVLAALKKHPAVYVVLHVNHADEITLEVSKKLAMLADSGIPLLSQSVLLKDINDNAETLTKLFRKLLVNRVKPYYLHHGDLAKGTGHFRTSIKRGQELMRELRGPLSGLCQPQYVLDLPGGYGKVPIGHQYLERLSSGAYELDDVFGGKQSYEDTQG